MPFAQVSLISADTAVVLNQGITSATTTIGSSANATKIAAATARQALLQLASEELGADASDLQVRDGVSLKSDPEAQVSYGALIGGRQFGQVIDPDAALKAPTDYRIVGQSVPRIDIPGKVTAAPGTSRRPHASRMVFARTLRAPAYGARLTRYDESVASQPGIVAVLPFRYPGDEGLDRVERLETMPGDFIAVVAEREDQALRAVEQLWESAEWELGDPLLTTSDEVNDWLLANGKDLELQEDHANIEEEYWRNACRRRRSCPPRSASLYQSYAPISPAWALADVQDDRPPSGPPRSGRSGPGWSPRRSGSSVTIRSMISGLSSGLYGRRDDYDQEVDVEAALISQAVGRPVRLQWSRQNEFVWSQYRPAQIVTVEGALTDAGHLGGPKADVWTAIRGVHSLGPTSAFADAPYDLGPRS